MRLVSASNPLGSRDAYVLAYVKAAARDIKAYLSGIGSSALVGYAAVDGDPNFRNTLAEYLTCGNSSVEVDLYGKHNISMKICSTLREH